MKTVNGANACNHVDSALRYGGNGCGAEWTQCAADILTNGSCRRPSARPAGRPHAGSPWNRRRSVRSELQEFTTANRGLESIQYHPACGTRRATEAVSLLRLQQLADKMKCMWRDCPSGPTHRLSIIVAPDYRVVFPGVRNN